MARARSDQRRVFLPPTASSLARSRRRRDVSDARRVDNVSALRLHAQTQTTTRTRHTVSSTLSPAPPRRPARTLKSHT